LEQIAWLQAKGLAAKGHQVALVAPTGSVCPGVRIIEVGIERTVDEMQAYNLYWQHLLEADVVICHDWMKWAYMLKQEGRLKAPVLGWMHAPVNTMYQSLPPVDKPCIVCISEDQKNHFEALFNRPARRCYNAVDGDFYKPLDIPRTKRFLFLARFSTIKGPKISIEVCKELGVGLDLVGDTSITNEPDYLRECLKLADGEQIRFVGGVSRSETVWWYSQAHALLHSAKDFREPFGLAPVEALACGCPVISFDNGAMRETIGIGGLIAKSIKEFKDLVAGYADRNTLDNHRIQCHEAAKNFSVERMVNRVEELCKEAISTGGW